MAARGWSARESDGFAAVLNARSRVTSHAVCPRNAVGWTHVWGEGKQVRITDGQAYVLVMLGMIRYSPEDGPNARVYRCCDGVSIDAVERSLA